ncbi:hypothetical protein DKX38_023424 [Salix brachista]|uniref:ABC transporter domain-containing protein n=1 Tax=Salix brachista TaxID=2182728 RepID=A0A5N5JPS2_9ROSI|nr:hypothetical protein DKX38_023424 [Salix brachista]
MSFCVIEDNVGLVLDLTGHERNHLKLIANLSRGQKARVVSTSVSMSRPRIMLSDEPTNHLEKSKIWLAEDGTLATFPGTFEEHEEEIRSDNKAEVVPMKLLVLFLSRMDCRILESQHGLAGQIFNSLNPMQQEVLEPLTCQAGKVHYYLAMEIPSISITFLWLSYSITGNAVPDCTISLLSPEFGLLGAAVLLINYVRIEIDVPCSGEILINHTSHRSV